MKQTSSIQLYIGWRWPVLIFSNSISLDQIHRALLCSVHLALLCLSLFHLSHLQRPFQPIYIVTFSAGGTGVCWPRWESTTSTPAIFLILQQLECLRLSPTCRVETLIFICKRMPAYSEAKLESKGKSPLDFFLQSIGCNHKLEMKWTTYPLVPRRQREHRQSPKPQ